MHPADFMSDEAYTGRQTVKTFTVALWSSGLGMGGRVCLQNSQVECMCFSFWRECRQRKHCELCFEHGKCPGAEQFASLEVQKPKLMNTKPWQTLQGCLSTHCIMHWLSANRSKDFAACWSPLLLGSAPRLWTVRLSRHSSRLGHWAGLAATMTRPSQCPGTRGSTASQYGSRGLTGAGKGFNWARSGGLCGGWEAIGNSLINDAFSQIYL